jgi:hypothetical protein
MTYRVSHTAVPQAPFARCRPASPGTIRVASAIRATTISAQGRSAQPTGVLDPGTRCPMHAPTRCSSKEKIAEQHAHRQDARVHEPRVGNARGPAARPDAAAGRGAESSVWESVAHFRAEFTHLEIFPEGPGALPVVNRGITPSVHPADSTKSVCGSVARGSSYRNSPGEAYRPAMKPHGRRVANPTAGIMGSPSAYGTRPLPDGTWMSRSEQAGTLGGAFQQRVRLATRACVELRG